MYSVRVLVSQRRDRRERKNGAKERDETVSQMEGDNGERQKRLVQFETIDTIFRRSSLSFCNTEVAPRCNFETDSVSNSQKFTLPTELQTDEFRLHDKRIEL